MLFSREGNWGLGYMEFECQITSLGVIVSKNIKQLITNAGASTVGGDPLLFCLNYLLIEALIQALPNGKIRLKELNDQPKPDSDALITFAIENLTQQYKEYKERKKVNLRLDNKITFLSELVQDYQIWHIMRNPQKNQEQAIIEAIKKFSLPPFISWFIKNPLITVLNKCLSEINKAKKAMNPQLILSNAEATLATYRDEEQAKIELNGAYPLSRRLALLEDKFSAILTLNKRIISFLSYASSSTPLHDAPLLVSLAKIFYQLKTHAMACLDTSLRLLEEEKKSQDERFPNVDTHNWPVNCDLKKLNKRKLAYQTAMMEIYQYLNLEQYKILAQEDVQVANMFLQRLKKKLEGLEEPSDEEVKCLIEIATQQPTIAYSYGNYLLRNFPSRVQEAMAIFRLVPSQDENHKTAVYEINNYQFAIGDKSITLTDLTGRNRLEIADGNIDKCITVAQVSDLLSCYSRLKKGKIFTRTSKETQELCETLKAHNLTDQGRYNHLYKYMVIDEENNKHRDFYKITNNYGIKFFATPHGTPRTELKSTLPTIK
jgi:hypothetical protein